MTPRPLLLSLALALLSGAGCTAPRAAERSSASKGRMLALAAPDLDGRQVDVAAERGKVRVIEFWATWCEPCREALPALDELARALGPRGLVVYAVSVDEDRARVVEFLRKVPVSFPVLWDPGAEIASRLDVAYMPATLLVDREGRIRHVYQGWDAGRERREREAIEALLAER
jgi:thiol-disulfide isomerase/thioredoxin